MPPKAKGKNGLTASSAAEAGLPEDNPFARPKPANRKPNIVKSGNAGSSKPATPLTLADGTPAPAPLFPVGSKTPLSLLQERCQKMGWARPSIDPKKVAGSELWSGSVTLRRTNAKGVDETVYMRPPPGPSPIAVEKASAMEAKHYAAIYALFRFANNLQLKLQLPPTTRDYWAALEAEKAASPPNKAWLWSITPFETAAAAPPPPSAQATTPSSKGSSSTKHPNSMLPSSTNKKPITSEATLPKRWLDAPEVKMPSALRELVETTIRDRMAQFPSSSTSFSDYEHDSPLSLEDQRIVDELVQLGFRRGPVLSAVTYVHAARSASDADRARDPLLQASASQPIRAAVTQYLHLHTPEEDLPVQFRNSRPADANARIVTSRGTEELGKVWWSDSIAERTAFPKDAVLTVVKGLDETEEEGVVVRELVRRLVGAEERQEQGEEPEGFTDRLKDELEALEGLFGTRFSHLSTPSTSDDTPNSPGDTYQILLSNPRRDKEHFALRFVVHSASSYPSPSSSADTAPVPTFYCHSTTLPTYITLHLTSLLASNLFKPSSDWLELAQSGFGGVVGEMANFLAERWRGAVEQPPDARSVLRFLNGRVNTPATSGSSTPVTQAKGKERRRFVPPKPTREMHEAMRRALETNMASKGYEAMRAVREKLPAWGMREQIVELIKNNRVVIVSGETGSGKTTQVPSFVLDDLILSSVGASANIVVTQPRRVSAIGVATRVGAERMEDINDPSSRALIGYAIRGERKAGRDCKILFCTTGVILSRLSRGGDPNLEGVSHIFIDEVHERSVDSDFLLLELRDILKRNPRLKVILMSATINQAQFSNYFGGAPCIEIPGFTHPVVDHYLEEILPNLPPSYQTTSKPSKKATQAQLDRMRQSFMARGVSNERTLMALEALTRSEKIDYNLVGATAAYCLERSKGTPGGVLVFMPGVLEIKQAVDAIRAAAPSSERIEVFPLHANLSSAEQSAVFRPVKPGHRKVVVATNVAETSITIDGIVYVIDCGRVKENTFDPETGIVRLVETWTSKAASRQRRGRAGRTRPGECFKLFSHYTEETVMSPFPTPEIVRIPLEMLCLQIKAMRDTEDVKVFLGKALNPPDVRAIDSAWATLRLLGAIGEHGGTAAPLTPLGAHLAMIPVDLRLGKMLILASIFRCLDPILTVTAMLSSKPFFLNPMEKRDEAKKARSMFYISRSDLLSDAKAFDACLVARERGHSELRMFAEDNFISLSTFRDVTGLKNEYATALSDVGFLPFRASTTAPEHNRNSSNENLLKAIIFAGTGRLVKVRLPPATYDKGSSGAIERDRESREVKFFEKDGRVFLHPGSLLFTETRFASPHPLFTFFNKHVTTKPFLRDATEVPLYGLLLFGPRVRIDQHRGLEIGEDGWTVLRAWPRIGVLVNALRTLFDADLEASIDVPSWQDPIDSPVVQAMLACLERDGGLQ